MLQSSAPTLLNTPDPAYYAYSMQVCGGKLELNSAGPGLETRLLDAQSVVEPIFLYFFVGLPKIVLKMQLQLQNNAL